MRTILCYLLIITCFWHLAASQETPQSFADALDSNGLQFCANLIRAVDPKEVWFNLPMTAFAPTDYAINEAAQRLGLTTTRLLERVDISTAIMTAHIVPGKTLVAADITTTPMVLASLNEGTSDLTVVRAANGDITVNGYVAQPDVVRYKDVIVHAIDTVIIPETVLTLLGLATTPSTRTPITVNATMIPLPVNSSSGPSDSAVKPISAPAPAPAPAPALNTSAPSLLSPSVADKTVANVTPQKNSSATCRMGGLWMLLAVLLCLAPLLV